MTEKSESSSVSSSSYTAESLANEITKRIYKNTKGWEEEDRKVVVYRQIRDVIKLVVKDTFIAEQEGQRKFKMSLHTDLERILNRLKY